MPNKAGSYEGGHLTATCLALRGQGSNRAIQPPQHTGGFVSRNTSRLELYNFFIMSNSRHHHGGGGQRGPGPHTRYGAAGWRWRNLLEPSTGKLLECELAPPTTPMAHRCYRSGVARYPTVSVRMRPVDRERSGRRCDTERI